MALDKFECRKVCKSHAPHYEGDFCGYADTLAGCDSVCAHITCKEDLTAPNMDGFRRADGMLKGKQEIFGLEVPKVLVIAGVAVAAYFIMKKVK
jgi:hypothetical protein